MDVSRRRFLETASVVAGGALAPYALIRAVPGASRHDVNRERARSADYTIRIRATALEVAPKKIVSVTTYDGQFPGPLLRFKEGQRVVVDLVNETDSQEQLHWHGQLVPVDVDGAAEEGTPFIPARAMRRISFVPGPSGYRFFHTHNRAGADLSRGLYGGASRYGLHRGRSRSRTLRP